ncbi:MAG: lipid II flippase MurJ [FCB group bacterium]|jgi:putative peptidoglycan lipid II flippase|nr:lipid II flippase MurJ [FCB group bacterium]
MAVSMDVTRRSTTGRTVLAHILSLAGLMALVRVTGFAEKQFFAARFGATFTMDVYFIALSLPMMVFFSATALFSPTFQPVFIRRTEEGEEHRAWSQFRAWRMAGFGLLCVVSASAALGAEHLAGWLGPGLDSEHRVACARLIRILSPAAIVMGLLPLTSAVLNGRRRFSVPPLADIAVRGGTIVTMVLFSSRWGIYSAAAGYLAGVVLAGCLHTWFVGRVAGRRGAADTDWRDPDLRYVAYLMLAPGIGTVFARLSGMVENAACSTVGPGAVSALEWARRIVNLPLLIIPVACATVLYTLFSELRKRDDPREAARLLAAGLHGILYFLLPVAALTMLLAEPVVAVVYQRGHFDAAATAQMAGVLVWLAPEMCFEGMEVLLMRYFFSREEIWAPVMIGVACATLKIGLVVGFVGSYGIAAVAAAVVVSRACKVSLLIALLHRRRTIRWCELEPWQFARLLPCVCVGVCVAAAVARAGGEWAAEPGARLLGLAASGGAGFLAYAGLGLFLGLEESRYLARKLGWRAT